VNGEIIHSPGHNIDSVTLILHKGRGFIEDLHPNLKNTEAIQTRQSWDKIHQHEIIRIFAGHVRPHPYTYSLLSQRSFS
jgi:hypothetical protein